jgi:DNA polymerase-3 subunit gamma/tau
VTETWALKYRPRTFDDLVGQPAVQIILRRMLEVGQVPSAMLFAGCKGTGKTTTARIVAAVLNCQEPAKPCGTCVSCKSVFDGTSMDVIEIDAASTGNVDDIRTLRQNLQYRQTGDWRIVILDEAQSISPAGFNALLKTLEEGPPRTLFVLCTTELRKIPGTVASRTLPFHFKKLAPADIAGRLACIARAEGHPVEPDLLDLLADRADGAMRDAIMTLDQVARIGLSTAEQYQRLIGHTDHAASILDRLAAADLPAAFARLDEALRHVADAAGILSDAIHTLCDVVVLQCGGEVHKNGLALAIRQNLALSLNETTVVAAMKIIWQLQTQVRLDDARATLELALIMLAEVFQAFRPATPKPPAKISLSEMKFT